MGGRLLRGKGTPTIPRFFAGELLTHGEFPREQSHTDVQHDVPSAICYGGRSGAVQRASILPRNVGDQFCVCYERGHSPVQERFKRQADSFGKEERFALQRPEILPPHWKHRLGGRLLRHTKCLEGSVSAASVSPQTQDCIAGALRRDHCGRSGRNHYEFFAHLRARQPVGLFLARQPPRQQSLERIALHHACLSVRDVAIV
mmetsp:Transcript_19667/g.48939  ORF Transcript_19667/g.48939 Transcript_19667/m.48939 type:complete len:202 (+) Transcript_19667:456-1061(+)